MLYGNDAGTDIMPGSDGGYVTDIDQAQVQAGLDQLEKLKQSITDACYTRAKAILIAAQGGTTPSIEDMLWIQWMASSMTSGQAGIPADCKRPSDDKKLDKGTLDKSDDDGTSVSDWPWWVWALIIGGVALLGYWFYKEK